MFMRVVESRTGFKSLLVGGYLVGSCR
uniref:Uncharacterized protein n=1 Tax=Arundo donax TaxID=35708 RepID=A0A0A8YJC5_ARUDO